MDFNFILSKATNHQGQICNDTSTKMGNKGHFNLLCSIYKLLKSQPAIPHIVLLFLSNIISSFNHRRILCLYSSMIFNDKHDEIWYYLFDPFQLIPLEISEVNQTTLNNISLELRRHGSINGLQDFSTSSTNSPVQKHNNLIKLFMLRLRKTKGDSEMSLWSIDSPGISWKPQGPLKINHC